jgi:AraC family transcriptional regulator
VEPFSGARALSGNDNFHGLKINLRTLSGAKALRVVHPAKQTISPHRHDWPCITLHILGSYTEQFEDGEVRVDRPSAVFHPAGGWHANQIQESGLETVSIQFDPAWLRGTDSEVKIDRARCWTGGRVGSAASRLAAAWTNARSAESDLVKATTQFLAFAYSYVDEREPAWLGEVTRMLDCEAPPSTRALAAKLDIHPAWLARVYRKARGESTQQTLRRRQVEKAVTILRSTDLPLSEVAVASGFFDQSHMNRGFRLLLDRTPREVRSERRLLALVPTYAPQAED